MNRAVFIQRVSDAIAASALVPSYQRMRRGFLLTACGA